MNGISSFGRLGGETKQTSSGVLAIVGDWDRGTVSAATWFSSAFSWLTQSRRWTSRINSNFLISKYLCASLKSCAFFTISQQLKCPVPVVFTVTSNPFVCPFFVIDFCEPCQDFENLCTKATVMASEDLLQDGLAPGHWVAANWK